MIPSHYGWIFRSLDDLAFAARERAERLREPPRPKASGRKLEPETELLFFLDVELREIPARRRRSLMAALVRDMLGVDVGGAERVRLRLKDYSRRHP